MKLLIFSSLLVFSLNVSAQYPDKVELQEILDEVIAPMEANEMDVFFERIIFPFEAGDKKYSKSELSAAYTSVFAEGTTSCLNSAGSYQMAMPDDHSWYLAVCFAAPEGYEAAVYIFRNVNDIWMLESIDFQKD